MSVLGGKAVVRRTSSEPTTEIGQIEIPQRSSAVLSFPVGSTGSTGSETPRVHHPPWRRGRVAARSARADIYVASHHTGRAVPARRRCGRDGPNGCAKTLACGQQFIIENRPGAGGVIGTRAAAKAA